MNSYFILHLFLVFYSKIIYVSCCCCHLLSQATLNQSRIDKSSRQTDTTKLANTTTMASAFPSLSSTSSSFLHHCFTANPKPLTQFPINGSSLSVFAQKKTKKTRKVTSTLCSLETLNQTFLHFDSILWFLVKWVCLVFLWCEFLTCFAFCEKNQIILKEDVVDVGKKGELLDVRAGFYRNFLLPNGHALLCTPQLLK